MGSHYFNKLPDGTIVDFTKDQFLGRLPADLLAEERVRDQVLSNPETKARYELLKERFGKE